MLERSTSEIWNESPTDSIWTQVVGLPAPRRVVLLPPTKKAFAEKKSAIVTVAVSVPVPPVPSSTVRVTVKVPVDVYGCMGLTPLPELPSPKSHEYVSASPSGSELPDPLKLTGTLRVPVYGPPASAVGAWFTLTTVTWKVFESERLPSETLTSTGYTPESAAPGDTVTRPELETV